VITRDAPEEGRIYLTVHNDFGTPICLYPTAWPDARGAIDTAATRASIEVDGTRFPMADLDAGYCPGCRTAVQTNRTATAFVNYADFNLPRELQSRPKRLVFQPIAQRCR
jgi:hypothetical protein